MHVEKSFFESTIGLLLNIPSKTNDGLSAHKDLQALEIREELDPQERLNKKTYLPPGSYTLTIEDKRANMQVSAQDQSPHRILNKYKKSGLYVRTKNEWL
jgi:hypothetical protein